MSGKLTKGTPVVSLADGAMLGKIDHVYLDPESKELVAFSFRSGGGLLGGGAAHLVDMADVHAVGPDAVTLADAAAVRDELAVEGKRDGLIDLDRLLKRTVITEGGTTVGQVIGLEFAVGSYRLAWLEVSPGFFPEPGLIAGDEVRRIGDELIVVSDDVCEPAARCPEPAAAAPSGPAAPRAAQPLVPLRRAG